jgi:leucine dehydrogenase
MDEDSSVGRRRGTENLTVFTHPDFDGHERIVFAHDHATGLRAIIAVHSTKLGPAAGGCRMWPYASEEEALADVLRLSRGMTYKNAVAGLDLGGGKAVIIADPRTQKTTELMRSFGRAVNDLGGSYITAEDVGIDVADMEIVREMTRHVAGLSRGAYASGDPSPVTARGVFEGLKLAVAMRLKRETLDGVRVAVQGLGHVGRNLCALLHEAGAVLVVSDIDTVRMGEVVEAHGASAVASNEIMQVEADVLAPCALGGILNETTLPALRVAVVAGAANNQLAGPCIAQALHERGILYVPDYALNAGGIINVAREIAGINDPNWVEARLKGMLANIGAILREAYERDVSPSVVADEFARRRLAAAY